MPSPSTAARQDEWLHEDVWEGVREGVREWEGVWGGERVWEGVQEGMRGGRTRGWLECGELRVRIAGASR